jgi:hypothetical protein
MIRDKIDPEKDLGHSDIENVKDIIEEQMHDETEMDDETATEQRRFFGVD